MPEAYHLRVTEVMGEVAALFDVKSLHSVQLDKVGQKTLHPPLFIPSVISCHFSSSSLDVQMFYTSPWIRRQCHTLSQLLLVCIAALLYNSSIWDVMVSKGLGSFPEKRQHNFCSPLINQAYRSPMPSFICKAQGVYIFKLI